MVSRGRLLLGREAEMEVIRSFLAGAAVDGRALLLTGPAGIGRTALLDAAATTAAASGAFVARAAGAEDETDLPFAGLGQLIAPLSAAVDRLPQRRREVLSTVLDLGGAPAGGSTPDDVVAALVAVLEAEAGVRPVIVLIDDLPAMDARSAECLRRFARGLPGHRIGLIATSRTGAGGRALPKYEVGPLDDAAAAAVLADRAPRLSRPDRDRVLREAQGNALALWELPLRPGQVAGLRLTALFGDRVAGLPASERRMLLLAALADATSTLVLSEPEELRRAERAGLVGIACRRVQFAHPAVRAAVIAASTAAERRHAHAVLAVSVGDRPDRRLWHQSEAATGPDEEIARELENAGVRLLNHGDAAGAVVTLRRCAELTPPGESRARRTARASYVGAAVAGDLDGIEVVIDTRAWDGSLWAAAARGYLLLHGDGDLEAAHRVLVDGLGAAGPRTDPAALTAALDTLLMTCRFADRAVLWPQLRALAARHDARVVAEPVGLLDPAATVRAGWAALAVDQLEPHRPALSRVLDDGRQGGAAGSAVNAAVLLALDGFAAGRWDDTVRLAQEAQALSASYGHTTLAMPAYLASALVAACRGDEDTCLDLTSRMIGWAAPRGARLVHRYAAHARALVALGRGDAETAYHQACAVGPAGVVELDGHDRLLVMDLVEAAVRSRRPEEAAAHVRAAHQAGIAGVSARSALLVAGAAALAEQGDGARLRYEEALAVPGADRFPFEVARVRLAYGEHLRRSRASLAARLQLTAALATFRGLGANPWTARAESELRAAGHRTLRARGPVPTVLSHQERTVAGLAATGATNRQIGERLGLSPRTVGSHLSRVFQKLGVTSRAALGAALRATEDPDR